MNGWNVISSSGNGWSVEQGPGASCPQTPGNTNFVTSYGWSRKSQLIDLVAAGFTTDYLDAAPRIYVSDWVCGRSDAASTYSLRVELRDAQQNVIKSFFTQNLDTPRAPNFVYPWRRVLRDFHRYGAGVRFVYFEHGGSDVPNWAGYYGAKMTGASVQIATALSAHRNLLQNPDGAAGMAGWNIISSSGQGWSVEGVAASCPSSAGHTNFVTSYGWSRRSQTIDLIAAGYSVAQLDAAPEIRVEEWMCGRSDAASKYYLTVNLLDANHAVVASFQTGELVTPLLPNYNYPFTRIANTFLDYGPGVRYVSFEDGGTDAVGWAGSYGAKMTGAYVGVVLPPAHPSLPRLGERISDVPELPDNRVQVDPTNVVPSEWICDLHMDFMGTNYIGTGWLIATVGPNAVVVTAGHCVYDKRLGFARSIDIYPARNAAIEPYASAHATANMIQCAQPYIVDANGGDIKSPLYDAAAIVVPKAGLNWGDLGFTPLVAGDDQIRAATLVVAGYPGDKPADTLWTASGPSSSLNGTAIGYTSICTAGGQSGSPVVIAGTNDAVGIHVMGLNPLAPTNNGTATRLTADLDAALTSWTTPLTPDTRITSLELIIQTGDDEGAGTDDTITFTLKGQDFGNPDATWFKNRNERDQIDGYDITAKMNEKFPAGLFVRDLTGANYSIKRVIGTLTGWASWFWGNWEVEAVMLYVNGHRFHSRTYKKWLDEFVLTLNGTITERQ